MIQNVWCWYHLYPPEIDYREDGVGQCSICKLNPDENRRCKRFDPIIVNRPPITIETFDVHVLCPSCKILQEKSKLKCK